MKRKHMLVRVFLATADPIAKEKRSADLRQLCERALQLKDNGRPFVDTIHILWVSDPRYHPAQRDCGIGEPVFRDAVAGLPRIEFHTPLGGSFCGVLNYGLGVCRELGADFVWICSPESAPAVDQGLASEVSRRIARGDRVIGVAVNEEAVELTKTGAVANACSFYDLRAMQDTAGGFHPLADAPRDDFPSMSVAAKDGSTLCLAGVEEILVSGAAGRAVRKMYFRHRSENVLSAAAG